MFLLAEFILSYYLALVFQVSHVVSEVDWPLADKNNQIHRDWYELQVDTTVDYATDSWLTTVFTGTAPILPHSLSNNALP